jgi:predicted ATPase
VMDALISDILQQIGVASAEEATNTTSSTTTMTRNTMLSKLQRSLRKEFTEEEICTLRRILPESTKLLDNCYQTTKYLPLESQNWTSDVNYQNYHKDIVTKAKVVLRKLIRCITELSNLIIIFLQDIHFADSDGMAVIRFIFNDRSQSRIVLIATYHEQQICLGQPRFSDWEHNNSWNFSEIKLSGLDFFPLNRCLADVLNHEEYEVLPLTRLILARTNGNMHFVFQLLEYWQGQEWLTYSYTTLQFQWTWDLSKLCNTPLTENVAEIVSSRIHTEPPEILRILQIAACLGGKFDVATLLLIENVIPGKESTTSIESCIQCCVESRLLENLPNNRFMFFHEKIREYVLSFLPRGDDLEKMHLKIGMYLWEHIASLPVSNDTDLIFKCVEQLSFGYRHLKDTSVLLGIVRLCKRAGDRAVTLSAFSAASKYYQDGNKILDLLGNKWRYHRKLCTNIHVCMIDVLYFTGQYDICLDKIHEVLQQQPSKLSTMRANLIRLTILKSSSQLKEFINASLTFLRKLGISLPDKQSYMKSQLELYRTLKKVNRLPDDKILQKPLIQDPIQILRINVLNMMVIPFETMQMQNLATLTCCRAMQLCLKHGNCQFSAEAISVFAAFIIASRGWLAGGYRLGELALKVAKKVDGEKLNVGVNNFVHVMTKPWQRIPMSLCINPMLSGYVAAMKQGDPYNAYLAINHYFALCYYSSLNLCTLLEDIKHFAAEMLEYGQKMTYLQILPIWQCVLNLTAQSINVTDVEHGDARDRQHDVGNENCVGQQACWSYSMQIAVYMQEWDIAHAMAARLKPIDIGFAKSHILYPARIFFFAILAIQNARNTLKRKYFVEARRYISKLRRWVQHQAANVLHKLLLVEAEYMSLWQLSSKFFAMTTSDRSIQLSSLFRKYDVAITTARRSGFLQDAALASQLADAACVRLCTSNQFRSSFFFSSSSDPSTSYRILAFELWDLWGARAITSQWQRNDPNLFSQDFCHQICAGNQNSNLPSRSRYDRRISDSVKRKLST